MKMCQRPHRDRPNTVESSHQHHHHHHTSGHHHHHHHRGHHSKGGEGDHESMGTPHGPPGGASDICCHGQSRYPYAPYVEGSHANKRSHRKRDGEALKEMPPYEPPKRSKQRYKEAAESLRAVSSSNVDASRGLVGEEPPALPSRAHHSHRHLPPAMGTPQPPTLPPKPGEFKEEAQLCKIHSHAADIASTKRRQEEGKSSRSDDRKQPTAVGGHYHHHHRHMRNQDEPPEAPHRSRRRPVQSPALVGEDPQSLGISSPILGEERSRVNATRASPIMTSVTSTAAGKKTPTSKDYMEKIGSHKASIEALKRELRSVETASSAVTTVTSGSAMISNIAQSSRGGGAGAVLGGRTGAFSRSLLPESGSSAQLPYPPPSISPSDEAAARLADASGSASFGDLRSAILASTENTMGESSNQRKVLPKTPKENEVGLLTAPQDTTYLESESDSGPEQVGVDAVRRSMHESPASKHTTAPPPGMSSPREAPRPPSLPRSSSFSSTNSSESSSIVSYSRSQSLFSHGAAVSDESSLSQQSSSSDLSSDADHSFSSMSLSSDRYSHHRRPHHHYHTCHECVSRSQGHLQSYLTGGDSHRSLSRHTQRHSAYFQGEKAEGKRSKSSHSSRSGGRRPDSVLLKSLINDEIALETITRQQKLLKKELEKQKRLAAELEEAKRLTQKLLEEKTQIEKKIEESKKRGSEEETEDKSPLKEKRVDEEKNVKKEEPSVPSTSHHRERHHRSLSSGKRHHHHKKGHRHRRSSSGSDDERDSDEKSKKSTFEKREDKSKGRSSRQKHSHSRSRHRHHHKTSGSGEKDEQGKKSSKERAATKTEKEKEKTTSPEVQKSPAKQVSGEIKQVEQKAQSGLDGRVGIFQQLSEELPPPPPQSPPPPQHESKSLKAQKISAQEESSPREKNRGSLSTITSDEAGLARDIIKEVLKHTYSREEESLSSESLSTTQPTSSTSSMTPLQSSSFSSDLPISELSKRTRSMESGFMNPIELTSTCLEPVPEGRVAESYAASRPYRPELSTFLGSATKQREEKEDEDSDEGSDLDVEEIDSDSTSASEGSEDIEPFPLPPAPMSEPIASKESRQLSPSPPLPEETKHGREFHQVIEEIGGGAISETSLMECSVSLKPIIPMRLSQATVAEHPAQLEYRQDLEIEKEKVEGGNGEEGDEEQGEEQEISVETVISVPTTPSKKSRHRKKATKKKEKAAAAAEKKSFPTDEPIES
ncbi:unnamed protein product [Hymenolepis diminuta]|uniref:Uncharacterized protein n=1 Tax=Hymenolepis diminuta TaxID=6216 RepID=A0A564Z9H3_HYMDI|nr:unnamed protein product [Hymenolepis diminuta]